MPKVRDLGKAKVRFQVRASGAVAEYAEGVDGNDDWEKKTLAAEGNYVSGVQQAVAKKRFGAGVKRSGQEHYKKRAKMVGAPRFQQGVAEAGDSWQEGFEPYKVALEGAKLTESGPVGSTQNEQRMLENMRLLRRRKLELLGEK